jgi:hypothetical protein
MRKFPLLLILILLLFAVSCVPKTGMPADGEYTIQVSLSGGSGRAKIETPAALTVKDGQATVTVIWSSPYYEWMSWNGVQYAPVQTEGNSTFVLPVPLDKDLAVTAQTIAMSEPHVVAYTLHFDSSTIKKA